MLTDTTPLVALIDPRDPAHARCTAAVSALREPLETTWPCFTEAAYLLDKSGGWPRVAILLQMVAGGTLRVHHADDRELARVIAIMTQYRDLPCDLADASLVAASETLTRRVSSRWTAIFMRIAKPMAAPLPLFRER